MIRWKWHYFSELTCDELYKILALRQTVFILEQRCLYNDLDYLDQKGIHLLGTKNNELMSYLRIFPPDIVYPNATSLGRVVTAPAARKKMIGKEMLQQALHYLDSTYKQYPVIISAQIHLTRFYESFGFATRGDPYDEDGIIHIKMIKQPTATTEA